MFRSHFHPPIPLEVSILHYSLSLFGVHLAVVYPQGSNIKQQHLYTRFISLPSLHYLPPVCPNIPHTPVIQDFFQSSCDCYSTSLLVSISCTLQIVLSFLSCKFKRLFSRVLFFMILSPSFLFHVYSNSLFSKPPFHLLIL